MQVKAPGSCIFFKPCCDTSLAPGSHIIVEILVRVRAPTVHRPPQDIEVAVHGRHLACVFIPGAPVPPCPAQRIKLAIGGGHQACALVPRTPIGLSPQEYLQVAFLCHLHTGAIIPWAAIVMSPQEQCKVAAIHCRHTHSLVPWAAPLPQPLQHLEMALEGHHLGQSQPTWQCWLPATESMVKAPPNHTWMATPHGCSPQALQVPLVRPARLLFPTNLLGLCSPGDTTGGMRGGQTEGTGKVTLFLDVLA